MARNQWLRFMAEEPPSETETVWKSQTPERQGRVIEVLARLMAKALAKGNPGGGLDQDNADGTGSKQP